MTEGIPYVDLSRMKETPKCAVICRSTDELEDFIANANMQLPEYTDYWDLDHALNMWRRYTNRTGFTLFACGVGPVSMSYCNEGWFLDSGYEIIELSELYRSADIDESDQPDDVIFGGVRCGEI